MKTLDRYIGNTVISGSLLALAVLLAMFTFFALTDELDDVGRGSYGVWNVLEFLALTLPRRSFELFPIAALLGSLLGLGSMAAHSELMVIRAAGVSLGRISMAVMKGGAVLMAGVILLGEVVAPAAEEFAQNRRSLALYKKMAMQTRTGIWVREGTSFVNIQRLDSESSVGDVLIYELDEQHRLRVATHVDSAKYRDGRWLLVNVVQSEITGDRIKTRTLEQAEWSSALGPELVNVAAVKPERLSSLELLKYVRYLRENNQDSTPYELGLWSRLMVPVSTGVMIFLSLPFVFGSQGRSGIGQRLLVGIVIGIGFHLLNQTSVKLGLVYGLSPFLSAVTPTLLFFAAGLWLIRRH